MLPLVSRPLPSCGDESERSLARLHAAKGLVTEWPPENVDALDARILLGRHALDTLSAFDDVSLERLVESHPREAIQAHAMSGDSTGAKYTDIAVGDLRGKDVLRALERGRIWTSFVHVERTHPEIGELVEALYAELAARCPGFVPRRPVAHLLISSPGAQVFFHADAYAGLLWQIRGRKRVFVYPPWDERFLPREVREACLAGQLVDGPYEHAYDESAEVFTLEPGDFIGWPQSTPHRVENEAVLNVSLATEHETALSMRRQTDAAANFWFRRTLGLDFRAVGRRNPLDAAKRVAFRALRRGAKLAGRPLVVPSDETDHPNMALDPSAPRGFREIAR